MSGLNRLSTMAFNRDQERLFLAYELECEKSDNQRINRHLKRSIMIRKKALRDYVKAPGRPLKCGSG
jgi:hypothetical protein